jgi:thiol-disulfide isomerase/thioredoxin
VTRAGLVAVAAALACGQPSRAPQPPSAPVAKSAAISGPQVEPALVAGHVTLVDFWSESCAACEVVTGMIAIAIAKDDRIVIRKVDVGDGMTAVALAYEIGALPHWKIYDTHKRLRYVLIGKECLRAPTLARELLAEAAR